MNDKNDKINSLGRAKHTVLCELHDAILYNTYGDFTKDTPTAEAVKFWKVFKPFVKKIKRIEHEIETLKSVNGGEI